MSFTPITEFIAEKFKELQKDSIQIRTIKVKDKEIIAVTKDNLIEYTIVE